MTQRLFLVVDRHRRLSALGLFMAAMVLWTSVAAAAITSTPRTPAGALQLATAMTATPAVVTDASFVTVAGDLSNGVADSPLGGFPTDGTTFAILTSGDARFADDPNTSPNSTRIHGTSYRGAYDVVVLKVAVDVPVGLNCLSLDFRFLSEEYPEYVGDDYNDAFVAELDNHTWSVSQSTITAPNNFAFDANGQPVSVNSSGATAMSATDSVGTTYDGATTLLSASTPVTPGTHALYLSMFDVADRELDSAVFVDRLAVAFKPDPSACTSGAVPAPYELGLSPATATGPVAFPHTVTATLTTDSDVPVVGGTVNFTVTGANSASGSGVTDANGQTTFTYTGTNIGNDTISASYTDAAGGTSGLATTKKTWNLPPSRIGLSPPSATNVAGHEHCVRATVTDSVDNPVPGLTVGFTVNGANSASGAGVTNASGQASFCYTGTRAGTDTITASFTDATGAFSDSASVTNTYTAAAPATISLSPPTFTNVVGHEHCVVATVVDQYGNPVSGVTVGFTANGDNSAGGGGVTNANGQTSFCYTGTSVGTDTITASFSDAASGASGSATATSTFTAPIPAAISLSPPSATKVAGQQHCVTASVTDSEGNPVSGVTVGFTVNGANGASGSGVTAGSGQAPFCYTGTVAGADTITASFSDAASGAAGSATATNTYTAAAAATLSLSPKTATNVVDTQHCVVATALDQHGNRVSGVTVGFTVTGAMNAGGSAVTNTSGDASFCYTGPALPGTDVIKAFADTDGDATQDTTEPGDAAANTWILPPSSTGCKVAVGGGILADNGDRATFGGNAQLGPKGNQQYQDHGPVTPMSVSATSVEALICSADGKSATISGQATVDGAGLVNYRIDVRDLGEPGTADTYRIRLSNGYDSGDEVLTQGNIRIQT